MDPVTAGLLGAAGGMAGNIVGKFADWGIGQLTTEDQIDAARELRRTAYQDMVWSLRKAGLNPALAFGASPSTAMPTAIQTGLVGSGSDMANAVTNATRAGFEEDRLPSEISLNSAKATLTREQQFNEVYRRAGIMQEVEKNDAWIKDVLQSARTGAAQELLYQKEAERNGASKAEIEERTRQYKNFGLPGQSWEGILRQFFTSEERKAASGPWNLNKPAERMKEGVGTAYEWGKDFLSDLWNRPIGGE